MELQEMEMLYNVGMSKIPQGVGTKCEVILILLSSLVTAQ